MDIRNLQAEEGSERLAQDRRERRRWPLGLDDPQPLAVSPRNWRGVAQVATVGIFIIMFIAALSLARPVLLPTTAAFVVALMLSPLSEQADRIRIPTAVTAVMLWLAVLAVFYAVITLVSSPVVDWIGKAPDIGRTIQDKLQLLDRPLTALRDIRNAVLPAQSEKGLDVDLVAILQQAALVVTPAVGQLLIFFVALFFMLLGRRHLRHVFVRFFSNRDARLRTLKIMTDIERNLTGYLSVVGVINAGVGIGAGIIAAVVGLPDPVAWGVLGFVLNFLPYIGAGIMELGMFLVGVVTFDSFAYAMIAPLAYIGMAMIEGQFLTPGLVGRKFTLNPLTVFLSMVFWAWLWGPVGAFLAVPLLIIGLVATAHLFPKQEPELPD
jgi:predicted PurR-regulated permease PerM